MTRRHTLTPELRAFAETPDRYTRLSGDVTRFADERVCILEGATWAVVSGIAVEAHDVEPLLAEVRERIAADKTVTWWIGPSARPPDLHGRLQELGLGEPADRAPLLHCLACTEPPAAGDAEVRRVETFEEFLAATEVMWDAFEAPPERRERDRPHLQGQWDAARAAGVPVTFIAYVDDRPAGVGRSIYSERGVFLIAGSVTPWARGRGVYRALVRARWDDAVTRGTPALVTEALPDTSYPILKRLGFEDVCTMRRLEDFR